MYLDEYIYGTNLVLCTQSEVDLTMWGDCPIKDGDTWHVTK